MLSLYHQQLAGNLKRVLLIGSGLMAEAVVDYLLKRKDNQITIVSALVDEAKSLASRKERCVAHYLDVLNKDELRKFVQASDIVIAYLPPQFITSIAHVCLEVGRNMVTSQYTFPELKAIDNEVRKKGLLFLNEIGLDPGIDHLATIKVRDDVYSKGGKIIEYESWCGGVVSPEFCDNPFGYKFSWSPFAAIKNYNNDAKYLENNQAKYITSQALMYSTEIIHVNSALQMEGYANRDSLPYKELYKLHDCTRLIRGTLRYQGHCMLMGAMKAIGFTQDLPIQSEVELTWFDYLMSNLSYESNISNKFPDYHISSLANTIMFPQYTLAQIELVLTKAFNRIFSQGNYQNISEEQLYQDAAKITYTLKWMGCFDKNVKIMKNVTHVHNFAARLQELMNYKQGETDLVAMQHIFRIVYPGDSKVHVKKSTMVKIGSKDGMSAMALTVGTPTAVAAQLILDKLITATGVHMPNTAEINDPIMKLLEKEGIYCVETDE